MRMGDVHDLLCFGLLREDDIGKDAKRHEDV